MVLPAVSFLRAEKAGTVIVDIHVVPNAPRTQIDGLHDNALRVRLKAPPVEGKANQALIAWLAGTLGITRAQIELVRGQTSKRKQLRISQAAAAAANWTGLTDGLLSK